MNPSSYEIVNSKKQMNTLPSADKPYSAHSSDSYPCWQLSSETKRFLCASHVSSTAVAHQLGISLALWPTRPSCVAGRGIEHSATGTGTGTVRTTRAVATVARSPMLARRTAACGSGNSSPAQVSNRSPTKHCEDHPHRARPRAPPPPLPFVRTCARRGEDAAGAMTFCTPATRRFRAWSALLLVRALPRPTRTPCLKPRARGGATSTDTGAPRCLCLLIALWGPRWQALRLPTRACAAAA